MITHLSFPLFSSLALPFTLPRIHVLSLAFHSPRHTPSPSLHASLNNFPALPFSLPPHHFIMRFTLPLIFVALAVASNQPVSAAPAMSPFAKSMIGGGLGGLAGAGTVYGLAKHHEKKRDKRMGQRLGNQN